MSFICAENKKTAAVLTANVNACAETIERGFDMRTEANLLRDIAKDIGSGLFKILFMGKFKTGKSTLINAFVGKSIMATRATACTAVIATVKYGRDIDRVRVVYTPESQRAPEIFDTNQFARKFAIRQSEEQQLIKSGGRIERFAEVSHAEMFSTNGFFADGTCLIDSPGLEEDISRTTVTKKFLPRANAIVFTLDATMLFSAKEREYIADNFAGKHMTNLFFVVNKINQIQPDQTDIVKSKVRNQLEGVFTNSAGRFDGALYERRVFFLDAYGAECVRTNTPHKIQVGRREVEVPVTLAETGFIAFADELRNFLNSAERINALINSTLAVMKLNRDAAEQRASRAKTLRATNMERRKANLQTAQKKLIAAKKLLKNFPAPINQTADEISAKASLYLINSVETIAKDFEFMHMDEFNRAVNWGDLALLSAGSIGRKFSDVKKIGGDVVDVISSKLTSFFGSRLDDIKKSAEPAVEFMQQSLDSLEKTLNEQAEESAKPIVEFMQAAIRNDLNARMSQMTGRIGLSKILAALEKKLDVQATQFDSQLEEVTNVKGSLRSALAMSNWGVNFSGNSRQVTGTLPINFEWFGSIVTTVTAAIAIAISAVWLFLTPLLPVIIVGAIVYCVKEGLGTDDLKKKLLSLIVTETFDKLKAHIDAERFTIEKNISDSVLPVMTAQGDTITSMAQKLIDDADRTLKNFWEEKLDAADYATARDDANLRTLAAQIENVSGQLIPLKKHW